MNQRVKPFVTAFMLLAVLSIQSAVVSRASTASQTATADLGATLQDVASMKSEASRIVSRLVAGDYEGVRDNFDDTMKGGLSAAQIKQVCESVLANAGKYRSEGDPYHSKVPGGDGVMIRCQMERGAISVEVYFKDGVKVAGLWVKPSN